MKSRAIIAGCLVAVGMQSSLFAGGPGTTSGELLKIPVGVRAIGMGEAFTALANDSSSLYWNPAGMSLMHQKEATFMHSSLIEDVHYEHLAYVAPGDNYAFGTNFSYLGYGDIAGYDNNPTNNPAGASPTGNVTAYSYILNGGLSRMVTPALSLGLSGGLIHETLSDTSANTFAVNMGALYDLPIQTFDGHYRVGAAVQNLGPGLKFISERAPLPRKFKFGVAAEGIKKQPVNLTADVSVPNDNDAYISLGSEYWFREMVALRLGYAGSNDEGKGLRVGFGLKYNSLLFDYAYAGFGDFGATNRFSLSMRFGDKIRQLNAGERAILKEAKLSEKDGAYVPAIMAYNELLDKDPGNDHILHFMIAAHDRMAKELANSDIAQKAIPIPSPEDAAIAELVPDAPSYAQNTLPSFQPAERASVSDVPGNDPLGLSKLPEVSTLDMALGESLKNTSTPALSASNFLDPAADSPAIPAANPEPASNSPALTPTDIYGN